MPSNLPIDNGDTIVDPGCLYVVATPIGNREDITIRALRILRGVDCIAAEDTRHSARLLDMYDIKNKLISLHEHNEKERTPKLIRQISEGVSVALISDAGTPLISDPGYRLVKQAIENNIKVVAIPGVSAAITALSIAGLPTDIFTFAGFPPKKKGKRITFLRELSTAPGAVIFYESPKRVITLMEDIQCEFGDRSAVFSREMTKRYEETIRAPLSEIISKLKDRESVRGECTLIVAASEKKTAITEDVLESEIINRINCSSTGPSDLAKAIAREFGIPKNDAYRRILQLKDGPPM